MNSKVNVNFTKGLFAFIFGVWGLIAIATALLPGSDLESRCVFSAFAALFFVFAAAPWLGKKAAPAPAPAPVRFVPHWFLMLAIILVVILFIIAAVSLFWPFHGQRD
jgi:hypothetical protein